MTATFIAAPIRFRTRAAAAVLAAVVVVSIFAVQRIAGAGVRVFMPAFRAAILADFVVVHNLFLFVADSQPNKSPEPTAVGAVSSAIAVHAASRRWLSFFR
jgi:hypothetical protein